MKFKHAKHLTSLTIATGLLLAALAGSVRAQYFPYPYPDNEWMTLETEHFYFHYVKGSEYTAYKTAKWAEIIWPQDCKVYDYWLTEKIHVLIRDQEENANGFAAYGDDWVTIWATPLYYKLRGRGDWIPVVFSHEFGHIVSLKLNDPLAENATLVLAAGLYEDGARRLDLGAQVLGGHGQSPVWWYEGASQYASHESGGYDTWSTSREMLLRMGILEDNSLDWDEMQTIADKHGFYGEMAYNHGFSLALYVKENYGAEKWAELAKNHRDKGSILDWNQTIKITLGISGEQLYAEWKAWLKKKYEGQAKKVRDAGEVAGYPYDQLTDPKKTEEKVKKMDRRERRKFKIDQWGGMWNGYLSYSPTGKYHALVMLNNLAYEEPMARDKHPAFTGKYFTDEEAGKIRLEAAEEKKGGVIPNVNWDSTYGWSPDETRVVVSALDEEHWYGNYYLDGYAWGNLIVYRLATKDTTQKAWKLTTKARAANPVWSPDGKSIIFRRMKDQQSELVRLDFPDDHPERIAEACGPLEYDVHWNIEKTDGPVEKEIWNPCWKEHGVKMTILLAPGDGDQIEGAAWSPDGSKLVFPYYHTNQAKGEPRYHDQQDLYLINADGTGFRPITWDKAEDTDPAWSPDGKSVLWSSDRTGIFNIYRMDLESGEITQLTNVVGGAYYPAVSPDGDLEYLFFSSFGFKHYVLPKEKMFNKKVENNYAVTEDEVREKLTPEAIPDFKSDETEYNTFVGLRPVYALPEIVYEDAGITAGAEAYFADYTDTHFLYTRAWLGKNETYVAAYFNQMWYPEFSLGAVLGYRDYVLGVGLPANRPDSGDLTSATPITGGISQALRYHFYFAGVNLPMGNNMGLSTDFVRLSYAIRSTREGGGYDPYLDRNGLSVSFNYSNINPWRGNGDINPRGGRYLYLSYAYANTDLDFPVWDAGEHLGGWFTYEFPEFDPDDPETIEVDGETYTLVDDHGTYRSADGKMTYRRNDATLHRNPPHEPDYHSHTLEFSYREHIAVPWYKKAGHTLTLGLRGGWVNRNVAWLDEFAAGGVHPQRMRIDIQSNTEFSGYPGWSIRGETMLILSAVYTFPVYKDIDYHLGPFYFDSVYAQLFGTAGNCWGYRPKYIMDERTGHPRTDPTIQIEGTQFVSGGTPWIVPGSMRREVPFVDIPESNGNYLLYDIGFELRMKAFLHSVFRWNSFVRFAYGLNDIIGTGDTNGDGVSSDHFPNDPLHDEQQTKSFRVFVGLGSNW